MRYRISMSSIGKLAKELMMNGVPANSFISETLDKLNMKQCPVRSEQAKPVLLS